MKRSGAKKIIMTFIVLALAAVNLNNCGGGSGGGSTTSLSSRTNVAINIGQTRSLSAHSKGRFVRQTSAIPPAVVSIRLTISAPDMNPLQQLIDVAGRSSVSLSFELQNGQNREFVAEALDASNNVLYRGEIFANLNGTPLHLTIVMVSVDPLPPVFAGLSGITDITETSMQLSWSPASDEVTPQEQIVYLIFLSTTPQGITGQAASTPPSYVTDPGATTFTVTGLIPDTEYFVQVLAMDQKGNRDNNTVVKNARTKPTPDTTPPTFGGLVSATALSESQIELKWDAASDNKTLASEIEYLIYMSVTPGFTPGEGAFATPKSIVTGVTSTTIAGLDPNTTYYFRAWARDKAGNVSKNDVEKSAKTPLPPDTTPPSFPNGLALSAQATSPSTVLVTWNPAVDDQTDPSNMTYIIYKASTSQGVYSSPYITLLPGDWKTSSRIADLLRVKASTVSYTVEGLTPDTNNCFGVNAKDQAGNSSANADTACVRTPPTPDITAPSVPTGLTATAISSSQINLAWNASTDDVDVAVTGYNIYRNGASAPSLTSSGTSASDTGLSPSTQYCYTVEAFDAAGNMSGKSAQACATTADTTAPSVPTGLTATAISSSQINLAWNASTDDVGGTGVAGYRIYRGGVYLKSVTATSASDTGLAPSTPYCYTVSAYDAANNESSQSTQACATTQPTQPPSPFIDLSVFFVYDGCSGDGCLSFIVHNSGNLDATNVSVYVLSGYFGPASCQPFFDITVPAGSFAFLDTSFFLLQDYYILIDPNNAILESDKSNNTACSGTFCTLPPIWPSDFLGCS